MTKKGKQKTEKGMSFKVKHFRSSGGTSMSHPVLVHRQRRSRRNNACQAPATVKARPSTVDRSERQTVQWKRTCACVVAACRRHM